MTTTNRVGDLLRLAVLLPLSSSVLPTAITSAAWHIQDVDTRKQLEESSLALTADGKLAVAYGSDSLYYAVRTDVGWSVEVVDRDCGSSCDIGGVSLVFDGAGSPAISYGVADEDDGELRLARLKGGSWEVETVDREPAMDTSLVFDDAGYPGIAYVGRLPTFYGLKFARWNGTGWDIEDLDAGQGMVVSLGFDRTGNAMISYTFGRGTFPPSWETRFARRNGATWDIEVLDASTGWSSALAVDDAGNPNVVYVKMVSSSDSLILARWTGTAWSEETVDTSSFLTGLSVAFDAGDRPAISYTDYFREQPRLARWDGMRWVLEAIEGGVRGQDTSLAFDDAGSAAISYYGERDYELRLARWDGVGWDVEQVDEEGDLSRTSLALDSAGKPAVSYIDLGVLPRSPGDLEYVKFARWDGARWRIETVTSMRSGAWHTGLTLDQADEPVIGYVDLDTYDLKVARQDGRGWTLESIDGGVKSNISVGRDGSGNPMIGYANKSRNQTRLARWSGTGWKIEAVDSAVESQGHSYSVAADAAGEPAIAYFDGNEDLKLARWSGSRWMIEVVDGTTALRVSSRWAGVSLAFDGAGNPAIAYCDDLDDDLEVARWNGASWDIDTVQSTGVRTWLSLAFDGAGMLAVAYHDWDVDALKFARFDGTVWNIETVDSTGALVGLHPSLAFDGAGVTFIGYMNDCGEGSGTDVRLAISPVPVSLHRGTVSVVAPDWKSAVLPLSSLTDDETPPFPIATDAPGREADPVVSSDRLVLYRVLGPGDAPVARRLYVVKGAPGVDVIL